MKTRARRWGAVWIAAGLACQLTVDDEPFVAEGALAPEPGALGPPEPNRPDAAVSGTSLDAGKGAETTPAAASADAGARGAAPHVTDAGVTALDSSAERCESCLIDGQCLPIGSVRNGDVCWVCDPNRSTLAYSPAVGAPCGGESECSSSARCDAQGACRRQPLPAGTPCGSPSLGACDGADTCDGDGKCDANHAASGTTCDPVACGALGACRDGACVAIEGPQCLPVERCSPATGACECTGCSVGGTCLAQGEPHPTDPCLVCDPESHELRIATGAVCGPPAGECHESSVCDAAGACVSRTRAAGSSCGDPTNDQCTSADTCDGLGACVANHRQGACEGPQPQCFFYSCEGGTCTSRRLLAACD